MGNNHLPAMKYKEFKSTPAFDKLKDSYCPHCLTPFKDDDELATCDQTEHFTHVECTKHNP